MLPYNIITRATSKVVLLTPLTRDGFKVWLRNASKREIAWINATQFNATSGQIVMLPLPNGGVADVLLGIDDEDDMWAWSSAVSLLPPGKYEIPKRSRGKMANTATLGWALGIYNFGNYKRVKVPKATLVWPPRANRKLVEGTVSGIYLTRDLINTPSSDMGPSELAATARNLAREFKAKCGVILGNDLLKQNYPMIHAVGRASSRAPRLIDLIWGKPRDPKITLVGKGVCFDSGGLDLKPASGMKLMKKDMGGAAHVLGLARMIMNAKLPVRLRVLIPAVENSVSGDAFRPLDILNSRAGISVEIGNTDAEGRLILADALYEAASESPKLILDFATLTGAARIAMGPELPAMFSNNDGLADDLLRYGELEGDPMWRLPLWKPYRRTLDSKIADINNIGDMPQGGAITAALFLNEFVKGAVPWAHFDIMAWNATSRPGRPVGGEAMAIRAAFKTISERFTN